MADPAREHRENVARLRAEGCICSWGATPFGCGAVPYLIRHDGCPVYLPPTTPTQEAAE